MALTITFLFLIDAGAQDQQHPVFNAQESYKVDGKEFQLFKVDEATTGFRDPALSENVRKGWSQQFGAALALTAPLARVIVLGTTDNKEFPVSSDQSLTALKNDAAVAFAFPAYKNPETGFASC